MAAGKIAQLVAGGDTDTSETVPTNLRYPAGVVTVDAPPFTKIVNLDPQCSGPGCGSVSIASDGSSASFNIAADWDYIRPFIVTLQAVAGARSGPTTGNQGTPVGPISANITAKIPALCPPAEQLLVNSDFQRPPVTSSSGYSFLPDASQAASASQVTGWITTAPDHQIELWKSGTLGVTSTDGKQFAELNAHQPATLYQDVPTAPGTKLRWRLSHRGRSGADTMAVDIGAPGAVAEQRQVTDDNSMWGVYEGTYTVPASQTVTRFALRSVSAAGGSSQGNFVGAVSLSTVPACGCCACVSAGITPAGQGWYQGGDDRIIFININLSTSEFDGLPAVTAAVSGTLVANLGNPGIYNLTATGFSVGIRWSNNTPLSPQDASTNGFRVHWFAAQPSC
ncbi:hypothetical protein [Streptomyces lavendulae]|uniref:hypothetical protein n=1 Tax=Streptomyces lavendulae TaxID=1914 RepID=UPI0033EF26E9